MLFIRRASQRANQPFSNWRRGWDSNPRSRCLPTQPLSRRLPSADSVTPPIPDHTNINLVRRSSGPGIDRNDRERLWGVRRTRVEMPEPGPQHPPERGEVHSLVVIRKPLELQHAFCQQRSRTVEVVLLVMIEGGGHLHDPMVEGSFGSWRRPPHSLQQLVAFKVEPGIEERYTALEISLVTLRSVSADPLQGVQQAGRLAP